MATAPTCPTCNRVSLEKATQYGIRHSCCGLHSWGGKELVSQEVHEARKAFHYAFDRIWKGHKAIRNAAYRYLAHVTGLPESECHGAKQKDLEILRTITKAAQNIRPEEVKKWWKEYQDSVPCDWNDGEFYK